MYCVQIQIKFNKSNLFLLVISSPPDSVMERPNLFNYHQEPENHGILLSPWQSPFSAMLSQAFTLCQTFMWGQLKQKVMKTFLLTDWHIWKLSIMPEMLRLFNWSVEIQIYDARCYQPLLSIMFNLKWFKQFPPFMPQISMEERQSVESS